LILTDDGLLIVLSNLGEDVVASAFAQRIMKAFHEQKPEIRVLLRQCAGCHEWRSRENFEGKISLRGVHGRKVASGDPSLYSDALRRVKGNWSEELLDRFLRDPAAMVPGTAMPFDGIHDDAARKQVVDFLKALQ
jgi:cytochrome c2